VVDEAGGIEPRIAPRGPRRSSTSVDRLCLPVAIVPPLEVVQAVDVPVATIVFIMVPTAAPAGGGGLVNTR